MSGIAEVLLNLGYEISGSDLESSDITQRLDHPGAAIHRGHAAAHIGNADVVVTSTAVRPDNPEVDAAHERNIPVIPRAEMLAELLKMKFSIAVSGSHGKTTTTSMVATILAHGGLDPTMVIGGKLASIGSNARLGGGRSSSPRRTRATGRSSSCPSVVVITNIDLEHLDFYPDLEEIKDTFVQYANLVPFYGLTILCLDDPNVGTSCPESSARSPTVCRPSPPSGRDSYSRGTSRFSVYCRDVLLGTAKSTCPADQRL